MSRNEIKVSAGTQLSLSFEKAARIIVLESDPKSPASLKSQVEKALGKTAEFDTISAYKALQACKQNGIEDADIKDFLDNVEALSLDEVDFAQIKEGLKKVIYEATYMGFEGRKMRLSSIELQKIESHLIQSAEECYTNPALKTAGLR